MDSKQNETGVVECQGWKRQREGQREKFYTLCVSVCVCVRASFKYVFVKEFKKEGERRQRTPVCVCVLVERWITSTCIFSAAMPSRTSAAASIYIREI